MTSLTGGSGEFAILCRHHGSLYRGVTGNGPQSSGYAGRITINPALLADPTRMVVFQTSPLTAAGDATRPNFILNQPTSSVLNFSPQAGIGTASVSVHGLKPSYMQQMLSQQGQDAANADSLNQGQQVVVNSLQQKFNSVSGVSIDEEMANLLQLQTAYGANSRVLSTVKDMISMLLQMRGGDEYRRYHQSFFAAGAVDYRHARATRRFAAPTWDRAEVHHLCGTWRKSRSHRSACETSSI